jgi:hypothetical protein
MLQRQSIRLVGARLAIFAVWLQVVLTFGHIHAFDIYLYGHPVVPAQGVTQVTADDGTTPVPSAPLQANEAGDQACSICANMALVAATVLPDPARIAPPSATPLRRAWIAEPLRLTAAPYLLFQTRAPPSA